MSKVNKKYKENPTGTIHYVSPIDEEFSVCSMGFDGQGGVSFGEAELTLELINRGKVDCKECLRMVKLWKEFLKGVR